jgi:Rho-binding antiterminator
VHLCNVTYRPIACSVHDQYLAWATLRTPIDVDYTDGTDINGSAKGLITDVFTSAEDRAEWMVLDTGVHIRLDKILRIGPTNP